MPYQRLMEAMVTTVSGATGAVFADQEGEAVVTTGRNIPKYELQVIGAYAGIFLSNLKRTCRAIGLGDAERFKLECRASTLLITDVKDGYYLVLVMAPEAPESLAWQKLIETRDRFVEEL